MRFLENKKQIREIINDEEIKTVQLIMGDNEEEICMVIGTEMFSTPYIIPYELKQFVYDELWDTKVKMFLFTDSELTEAWKTSYLNGGISEDRWDRRTIFHPYNQMNEMFCIDMMMLEQIKGENERPLPKWKEYIVDWYKEHLL